MEDVFQKISLSQRITYGGLDLEVGDASPNGGGGGGAPQRRILSSWWWRVAGTERESGGRDRDRGRYWEAEDECQGDEKGRGICIVPFALRFGHSHFAGIRLDVLVVK